MEWPTKAPNKYGLYGSPHFVEGHEEFYDTAGRRWRNWIHSLDLQNERREITTYAGPGIVRHCLPYRAFMAMRGETAMANINQRPVRKG